MAVDMRPRGQACPRGYGGRLAGFCVVARTSRKRAKPLPPKQTADALSRRRHREGPLDFAPNVANTLRDNPVAFRGWICFDPTPHNGQLLIVEKARTIRRADDPEDLRDPPAIHPALARDRRLPEPAPPSEDARSASRPSPNAQGPETIPGRYCPAVVVR